MINSGIFRKTFSDSLLSLVMASVGLIAFTLLFAWAMLNMGTDLMEFVSRFPFVQKIFEISLGIDVSGSVSIELLFSVVFTHGMVLLLTWSAIISMATRVTVGEMETGTADILYSLPVSRPEVYRSVSLACVAVAVILSSCPFIGVWIGSVIFETEQPISLYPFLIVAFNFLLLNLATTAISLMIGCCLNRRSITVGVIVGIVFTSSVMTFLEPFVSWLKHVQFLSLLGYLRPADIIRTGQWPASSLIGLGAIAVTCWAIGLLVLSRKDIPTA